MMNLHKVSLHLYLGVHHSWGSSLLWCTRCDKSMSGKMQMRTGPNKTRVHYAGYYCLHYTDKTKLDIRQEHWIMHATVEEWLMRKLGEVGREVDMAHEIS